MSFDELKSLKIAVLQTGRSPQSLMKAHGDYDDMCKGLINRTPAQADTFAVIDNIFPQDISHYDMLIITGSPHGVYDGSPWIKPLETLIRTAFNDGIKMLGLCFGHQIMAQALGGIVEKSQKGYGIGVMDYTLGSPFNDKAPKSVSLCAWHQDQVIKPPKTAKVIAASKFCPYAGLAYGNQALSFQPHPEFTKDFLQDLINLRRGQTIDANILDTAQNSLNRPIEPQIIQDIISQFFGNGPIYRTDTSNSQKHVNQG